MANSMNTSYKIGHRELLKRWLEGSLSGTFYSDELKKITSYGLGDLPLLENVILPNVTDIEAYGFSNSKSLQNITFGDSPIFFANNFMNSTGYTFLNCNSLSTECVNEIIIKTGGRKHYSMTYTSIGTPYEMFGNCHSICMGILHFPESSEDVWKSMFTSSLCFHSTDGGAVVRKAQIDYNNIDVNITPFFYSGIETLFLPNCSYLTLNVSSSSSKIVSTFKEIIFSDNELLSTNNEVCALNATGDLASDVSTTSIAKRNGGIYVPDELLDDYKSATNWSLISDYIFPISSYYEKHTDEISDSWDTIIENINNGLSEQYLYKKKVVFSPIIGYTYMCLAALNEDVDSNNNHVKTTWISEIPVLTNRNDLEQMCQKIYESLEHVSNGLLLENIKLVKKNTYIGNNTEELEEAYCWGLSYREMARNEEEKNSYEKNGACYMEYAVRTSLLPTFNGSITVGSRSCNSSYCIPLPSTTGYSLSKTNLSSFLFGFCI